MVAAALWSALEPLGPRAVVAGLRGIGSLAALVTGLASYLLARRCGAGPGPALAATAVVLFLPCHQMAAGMIGNEALAAAFTALALLPITALQRDPRDARRAAAAGLLAGLALATKYTGAFAALACAVPFVRRDLDRAGLRALAICALAGAAVAGPVYLRNVAQTGGPLPILREHEPTRSQEARNVLRPRRVRDYLWIDPAALRRPSIYHVKGDSASELRRNPAMTNVWGLLLASIWYDAFAHRIPPELHRDGFPAGPLLVALGLLPTGLMLAGFAAAVAAALRSAGRSPTAPLVATWLAGIACFVGFTGWAPSLLAVKGSYLLPLAPAGAVFFARLCTRLPGDLRAVVLGATAAATLASALVFHEGLLLDPRPAETAAKMARVWTLIGRELPASHIAEAVEQLSPGRKRP